MRPFTSSATTKTSPDPRPALQRPVASFDDTHAQDVTQVAFHPARTNMLVSGSEDGLIAVFDTSPQLGEQQMSRSASQSQHGPVPRSPFVLAIRYPQFLPAF